MATEITPDPAVALDAASLAALENTTVTVGAALPAGTNNIGDVDVLTLPALVAGTANIGDVDVLTLPALPAGTNAIGKLAANSGVDIGDVDVTSSALPTGASTSAKQPALGTAGTPSTDVISIQGVASGTVVPVTLPAIVRISQTPTVSTSPAYTAKDAVGGLLTFANAVRVSGGSGILVAVTVIDLGITPSSLELMLFDRTFTASTDNAIYDPTDADLANALPSVAINSWQIYSDNSLASVSGLSVPIVLTGTSLFGQLRTLGTPTYAGTTDITVMIEVLQN